MCKPEYLSNHLELKFYSISRCFSRNYAADIKNLRHRRSHWSRQIPTLFQRKFFFYNFFGKIWCFFSILCSTGGHFEPTRELRFFAFWAPKVVLNTIWALLTHSARLVCIDPVGNSSLFSSGPDSRGSGAVAQPYCYFPEFGSLVLGLRVLSWANWDGMDKPPLWE